MRVLWSLPKAAPALLRHLGAYVELAGWDLARSQRELAAGIVLAIVVAVALFFAVLMGCVAVLALTWDTPHRLTAILWMAGGFLAVAIIAILYRSSVVREQAPFLASVRREWQQDSVILEQIFAEDDPR